jgi:hypothetical protein
MPGVCKSCGEPTYRKTKGGKWYQYCDECRATEPPDDSFTDAPEDELPRMPEPPPAHYDDLPPLPVTALPEARPPAEVPQHKPYTVRRTPSEVRVGYRTDLPPDDEDVSRAKF